MGVFGGDCDERQEAGATMVEYALMAALIAIVCLAGVARIGQESKDKFDTVGRRIEEAGADNPPPPPPPPPP